MCNIFVMHCGALIVTRTRTLMRRYTVPSIPTVPAPLLTHMHHADIFLMRQNVHHEKQQNVANCVAVVWLCKEIKWGVTSSLDVATIRKPRVGEEGGLTRHTIEYSCIVLIL